jgi:hypothetical protein
MYSNELAIYPFIFTVLLFILNYVIFHKKLNEANVLGKIKNYELLRNKTIVIVILSFSLMIDASIYWFILNSTIEQLEKEISINSIHLFNYFQYATIILKNIVIFIFFKKFADNIERIDLDPKVFSKYLSIFILWISISWIIAVVWMIILFQEIYTI